MTLIDFSIFVAVGCGVGFLAGLFGVGGGILMVPVLVFSYGQMNVPPAVSTHIAIGTSLFVIIFASLTGAYQHGKQGNIDWRSVFILGPSSALTALGTSLLAAGLSGKLLRIAFAVIVFIGAIKMLTEEKGREERRLVSTSKYSLPGLVGVGMTAGIVSALAGVGGGIITIPMMYYFLEIPMKLAIGTSSATIVITAIFSVGGYIFSGMGRSDLPLWSLGFIDLHRGMALAIGSILLARVGAYVSFKISSFHLKRLFAVFILLISVYMFFK